MDYAAAHAEREVFAGELRGVFEDADLLLCPSMASVAPPLALFGLQAPWDAAALPAMRFTAPFDMSRNPCLALPCGFVDGLPASAQLVGRHAEEALLCRAGHAYESATPWHERHPEV